MNKFLARIARSVPVYRELVQARDLLVRAEQELTRIRVLTAAALLDRDLMGSPRYGEAGRLQRFSAQVNSQSGEDGIIQEIFRRIGPTNRIFAEIGVGNGVENNTAFLLSLGWSGVWIDSDAAFVKMLDSRPDVARRLRWSASAVDAGNVASLLRHLGVPGEFDLLSLDVDQNTYYIWEALGEFKPRVVAIEYNAAIPADIEWKVRYEPGRSWDGTQNFGASLKALERLGSRLGYALVGCDVAGANAFFVRQELVGDRFAAPFTAENHFEPARYFLIHRRLHPGSVLDPAAPAD